MIFNEHSNLTDKHAFLSASKYTWLNYDEDKLVNTFFNSQATYRGTVLHELCRKMIENRIKLNKTDHHLIQLYLKDANVISQLVDSSEILEHLIPYVNDAIGYRMDAEKVLYYSENCFGTVDAISFNDNFLRIHDLKTGVSETHIEQLEIYAALFCLEYGVDPRKIKTELRIYQRGEILFHNPEPDEIIEIEKKIINFDKTLKKIKE